MRNRFKRLDLIDRVSDELWMDQVETGQDSDFPRPRDKDQGSTWEADRQGLREWVVPQRKNKQTSMTSKERNDSKTNITEG